MKKKLIIDIMMFILMLMEFSRIYTGSFIHEIMGITLFILVIIHLFLNNNYLLNIPKTKYNLSKLIMLIINILLFGSFILTSIFGILSSNEILTFLNMHSLSIIKLHKIFSYITLIIIGLHIGINFNLMFGKLTKLIKNKIINYILSIIITIFGIYSFIKVDFWNHLIGEYGFGNNNGNIIINIIEYLSIVMMISIIMNYIYENRRKEK